MMNYIAIQILNYFSMIWSVPKGSGKIGVINANTEAGWIPAVAGNKYLVNVIIVAIITALMYVYLKYSKHGYEISVVGESQRTASYAGIKVDSVIIRTMVLSGLLCGLVGFLIVGAEGTVSHDVVDGRGYTAVMVSWMSQFNPFGMVFSSLLLVFMQFGAKEVAMPDGVSLDKNFANMLMSIILFFIIGCEFFITYELQISRHTKREE
jgi:simple sugar transport system permease protein